jgi:hypothetical protein
LTFGWNYDNIIYWSLKYENKEKNMKELLGKVERWIFVKRRYPVLMTIIFTLALLGAYWSKFNTDASFREAVTPVIQTATQALGL